MNVDQIRAGQVVYIGPDAGAQFIACPMYATFIRVVEATGWQGMAWIDVWQLDPNGDAIEKRNLYVIAAGLHPVDGTLPADALPKPRNQHAEHRNTAVPRLPRQRITSTQRPVRKGR
jgi:hypothetical protein